MILTNCPKQKSPAGNNFCADGTTIRPEMITQIIRKQFFCVTDVCVIGKLIPREFFCVIGIYRKYHMEGP